MWVWAGRIGKSQAGSIRGEVVEVVELRVVSRLVCSNTKKTCLLGRASPSAVVGRVGGPRMGDKFRRDASFSGCIKLAVLAVLAISQHRRRHWSSRGSIESLEPPRGNIPCTTYPERVVILSTWRAVCESSLPSLSIRPPLRVSTSRVLPCILVYCNRQHMQ